MLLFQLSGMFLLRYAQRAFLSLLIQDPPRTTSRGSLAPWSRELKPRTQSREPPIGLHGASARRLTAPSQHEMAT
jgi:hypothetical protein